MQLGKIVGTVVATKKDEKLEGLKLQIVRFINIDGTFSGPLVIAVDSVGAGVGEVVLVAAGSSARQTYITKDKPVDTVIMAIVDQLEVGGNLVYTKDTQSEVK
jgi:microcompartment protein CcmK/EutM